MSGTVRLCAEDGALEVHGPQVSRSLLLRDLCEADPGPTVKVPFSLGATRAWAAHATLNEPYAEPCSNLILLGDFLQDANFVDACARNLARLADLLTSGAETQRAAMSRRLHVTCPVNAHVSQDSCLIMQLLCFECLSCNAQSAMKFACVRTASRGRAMHANVCRDRSGTCLQHIW